LAAAGRLATNEFQRVPEDVSTAILIFAKGGRTDNVWFYDVQADG
jgi:hypothetical protein